MTHYREFFDWYIVLMEPLVVILCIVLLFGGGKLANLSFKDSLASVAAFIWLLIMVKVSAFANVTPYFPDTQSFALLIEGGDYKSSSLGVRLFYWVSTPIRLLSGNHVEIYLILQCFILMLSMLFVWCGWRLHCRVHQEPYGKYGVFLTLVCLYPSVLMFIPIPLREYLMVLGFSIFLYGLSAYLHFGQLRWVLIGSLITILVRPQLVILYPLMVVAAKQSNLFKLATIGILLLVAFVPLFELLTGYHFTPQFFAFLRERGTSHYAESGMTYGAVTWNTYFDVIIDLPALFLQFLLSPLPIMHSVSPLALKAMLVDVIFVISVLAMSLRVKLSLTFPYWKVFLLGAVVFSIWEFYIGGAVRHRLPLVLIILPMAGVFISKYIDHLANLNERGIQ